MNTKKNPKFLFLTKLISLVMLLSSIMNFSFFSTASAATYSYDTNLCYSSDLAYGLGIKAGKLYVNNTLLSSLRWARSFNFSNRGTYTYRSQSVQWSVSNISNAEKVQYGSYYSPYTGNIANVFQVRVENVSYLYWFTHYESGDGITEHSQDDVLGLSTPRYTNTSPYDSNMEGPLYMIINADTGKVADFYAPEYNFYYAMGIERAYFYPSGSVYPINLGVPTNLKYSATANSINVSWNSVANATGYDLEVDGQVIDIGNTLSYTQNNLQPDSQHTYRIRAKNSTSTGSWSNILTARTLKSNQPPVLSAIGNQTVDEGQPLQFTLNATDPDGDTLTYTTSSPLPTGATFDPVTKTFSWTPDYTQSGSYTVHFEVSDGQVVASEDITITVNNVSADSLMLDALNFIESLNLPQGRENSIISSLNNAITTWQNGNYTAATNKIDAIINKLEAMRGKTLTNEQADSAIEKMKEINSVIELQ